MKCAGCSKSLPKPAAYALMNTSDLSNIKFKPTIKGKGSFHAAAVCEECFTNPANRKRKLKAHFALPPDVNRMLGLAGSSGKIG